MFYLHHKQPLSSNQR